MTEHVKETIHLVDFTEKLRSYRTTLAFSYCFFIWSSLMIGLPLLHTSLMFSPWFQTIKSLNLYLLFSILAIGIITSLTLMFYVLARFNMLNFPTPKSSALYWSLSFSVPYATIYLILSILGIWDLMPVAWCLAGGISYTIIGLTVERMMIKRKLILSRPFILMGILVLLMSFPAFYIALQKQSCYYSINSVILWSWTAGQITAMIFTAAIYLLMTLIVSLYTFLKAERAIFKP